MQQTGVGEIKDDEIFKINREYPHKNPHIFKKSGVIFILLNFEAQMRESRTLFRRAPAC